MDTDHGCTAKWNYVGKKIVRGLEDSWDQGITEFQGPSNSIVRGGVEGQCSSLK